jgi:hypothetical protein
MGGTRFEPLGVTLDISLNRTVGGCSRPQSDYMDRSFFRPKAAKEVHFHGTRATRTPQAVRGDRFLIANGGEAAKKKAAAWTCHAEWKDLFGNQRKA